MGFRTNPMAVPSFQGTCSNMARSCMTDSTSAPGLFTRGSYVTQTRSRAPRFRSPFMCNASYVDREVHVACLGCGKKAQDHSSRRGLVARPRCMSFGSVASTRLWLYHRDSPCTSMLAHLSTFHHYYQVKPKLFVRIYPLYTSL